MALEILANRTAEIFSKCFGHAPRFLAAAPGRVNLIGEHTDYNNGYVLPMAIVGCTVIAGDRNSSREVVVHSLTTGETARFDLRPAVARGEPSWSNYVRGVFAGFQRLGVRVPGCELVIDSEVPFGGGLASSAALEVATATLLESLTRHALDPLAKAQLCQRAEHEFAGVPCGIMDQFTSVLAKKDHAVLLDCRSLEGQPVPMTDPEITVLIVNTNVRHKLADGEYGKRRAQCEQAATAAHAASLRDVTMEALENARSEMPPIAYRRARHVISENQRTLDMAAAISRSSWPEAGQLMYESHRSLKEDYEVSCPELDAVVDIARDMGPDDGVIGCRMTGAGFGGCAVALVKTEAVRRITRKLGDIYEARFRNQALIFSTRPGAGAHIVL